MNMHVSRLLYWMPRVLEILFAGFLGRVCNRRVQRRTWVLANLGCVCSAFDSGGDCAGCGAAGLVPRDGGSCGHGGIGTGLRDPIFEPSSVDCMRCGAGFCDRLTILPKLAWHAESYAIGSPG